MCLREINAYNCPEPPLEPPDCWDEERDYNDIPDHHVVAWCMRSGYSPWTEHREYTCPVCGAECETVYLDRTGQAVGCDVCLTAKDVYDYYEEMEK